MDELEKLGGVYHDESSTTNDPILALGGHYHDDEPNIKKDDGSLENNSMISKAADFIRNNGIAQSVLGAGDEIRNSITGTASLLPGVNIKPVQSGEGLAYNAGRLGGGLASFMLGGGALRAARTLPAIESGIARTDEFLRSFPTFGGNISRVVSSPLSKGMAGNAVYGAIQNPDHQLEGAGEGALFGMAGHGAGRLLGTQNPILKGVGGGILGAGVGYGVGGNRGAEVGGTVGAGAALYPGAGTRALKNVLGKLDQKSIDSTIKNARELGVDLRPTEITGRPENAALEGQLSGTTEGGSIINESAKKRQDQEQASINQLLSEIIPNPRNVSEETRSTAKSIIDKKKKERAEISGPLYEASRGDIIGQGDFNSILKDPYLNQIYNEVRNNNLKADKVDKYPANSVNMLDLMKKNIDLKIKAAKRGQITEDVSDLKSQKQKLLDITDQVSEKYSQARAAYSEASKPVTELEESPIGKLAKMKDSQLKNVAKTIFDPAETDKKVFVKLRDSIGKENPEVWRNLIRNEIERKLTKGNVEGVGSNFYDKILKDDKSFHQLMTATDGMPEVQSRLVKMRDVFGKIINPVTPKSANTEARVSQMKGTTSNLMKSGMSFVDGLVNGKYNKEAALLLTDPKWDKQLNELSKIKNRQVLAEKAGELLGKVSNILVNKPMIIDSDQYQDYVKNSKE